MNIRIYLLTDPLDCSTDKCHLAWLIRDNPNLLKYVVDATCSNGTLFTDLKPADFDAQNCP